MAAEGDDPERDRGGLRVGGPNDGADHCWAFAEFVLLRDSGGWRQRIEAAAGRLKRLGWKRSASLLIVVAASREDAMTEWEDDLASCAVWNQPVLAEPFVIALPGGGTVVVKALDIKRDPTHVLTTTHLRES